MLFFAFHVTSLEKTQKLPDFTIEPDLFIPFPTKCLHHRLPKFHVPARETNVAEVRILIHQNAIIFYANTAHNRFDDVHMLKYRCTLLTLKQKSLQKLQPSLHRSTKRNDSFEVPKHKLCAKFIMYCNFSTDKSIRSIAGTYPKNTPPSGLYRSPRRVSVDTDI